MVTHSSILAGEIPWTEEPGWATYSPWGHKESDMTEHACFIVNTLEPLDILCEGL